MLKLALVICAYCFIIIVRTVISVVVFDIVFAIFPVVVIGVSLGIGI